MTAKELVSHLQQYVEKYGDLDVMVNDYDIYMIDYDDTNGVINIEG